MAKALDGTALYTYFRRLGFSRETQELLMHIRSSPPAALQALVEEICPSGILPKDAMHHQGGKYQS